MELDIKLERDELADRLGGKLPRAALGLIEGDSGTGKSVLAQRLTYGLLQNDNDVVYVSTEFTTRAFLEQMEGLGYPIQGEFAEMQLMFCSTKPMLGHPVPKEERLPRLLEARHLWNASVVVVDCFSQIAEPHLEDGQRGVEVLEHLVRTLKQINETGTTILLTIDPQHFDGVDTSPLTTGADIRLDCIKERVGGDINRFIVPDKFARAAGPVGDVIAFRVEPGAGFIVEIKAVA